MKTEVPLDAGSAKDKARILIVDDEPDIVELLSYNFRQKGFQVFTAQNGMEGLDRARRRLPDLILLDVMLPDLDGFTVCELLQRLPSTNNIPVVMLTALDGEMARYHGLQSGAVEFLRKPFETQLLICRVQEILAAAAQRAAEEQAKEENSDPCA